MAGGTYADQTEGDPETAQVEDQVESEGARCARYADIAVELGYCGRERIDSALRGFIESGAEAQEFGSFLVEEGLITREQSRACERGLRGHSTIGGFSILEKVGQGGMGTVFRARQISMDRIVAVKILAPKYGKDPSFRERFLQEARTCAKLSHLNIINGIDCGEDSGYAYFAMEFVDGRTVKQILKEKQRLEPDEAFKIVRQIADALSYARRLGMVHRDIKPDNIMLTRSSTAKLCDLGLAMQAEQTEQNEAVDESELPVGGEKAPAASADASNGDGVPQPESNGAEPPKKKHKLALGTPHYMSPEQARGESNIDARSDIYSLGATFYHLISGKTMFEGKTSTEIMTHQVVSEAPNPCTLDPKIPAGLGAIISKMTAKLPGDRYADADELIADLEAVKNGQVPAAAAFDAKSSCMCLPPSELRRLREGGAGAWKRMIPHMAAALVLGVLAYFIITSLGKQNSIDEHPAASHTTTTQTSVALATTQSAETGKPIPVTTETTPPKPVEVKNPPDTVVKPTIPEPVKHNPDLPPVPPIPEAIKKPVVVEPVPPPPPPIPELPRPELKLTADILYARFLNEVENRVGRMELPKLLSELTEKSHDAAYNVARDDVKAELADIKAGLDFEFKALKRMADQKVEIEFPEDLKKIWTFAKGKAAAFDENRGIQVELPNGAAFYLAPSKLPIDMIVAKSADTSPLAKAQFNYARGSKTGVFTLLPMLSPPEQLRWERKFRLSSTREVELTAVEAFKNLTMIAEAKSWKTFSEMVIDFLKDYGTTQTFRKNAAQIKQWQEAALNALAPPSKWRSLFHAATVRDVPDRKADEALVELVYDFKSSEQILDFACVHGRLRIENGQLIVPEGGGEVGNVRLVAPFASIESFKAVGRSLHNELRPFGVVFIDPAQALTGPNQSNPLLKLNPETKFATLENMAESKQAFDGAPPAFNWMRPTTIGFTRHKGDLWSVDEKPIGSAKIAVQFSGGWIALWGAQGHMAFTRIEIVFRPDNDWLKSMKKGK